MGNLFTSIISLGAPVLMLIMATVAGKCIGLSFGKSFKSGLYLGVGFIGFDVITSLIMDSFVNPLQEISRIYHLQMCVFDVGWPAAATITYNTAVGAFIIPVCLLVNYLMLVTKTTRTVNITLWNYWHFAFVGAVVYYVTDHSVVWSYFTAIVCFIITQVMADRTAEKFQKFYPGMEGVSMPHPFVQSFTPFAILIGDLLDSIPWMSKLNVDAKSLERKFGVLCSPLVLGCIVGSLIGFAARMDTQKIMLLGVTMGAVMELTPMISKFFIDGLALISAKANEKILKNNNGRKLYIGMTPSMVIGHPSILIVSLLLIPVTLAIAVFLPGNQFLPLASLAGIFYIFPMIMPYAKGNILKAFIIGLVAQVFGLLFVTDIAPAFTKAIYEANAIDKYDVGYVVEMLEGQQAGALDFASALLCWAIFKCVVSLKWISASMLAFTALLMMLWNRHCIIKEDAERESPAFCVNSEGSENFCDSGYFL